MMRNGVIIIPPHEFKQPSRWYYRMWESILYEIGVLTYGITSTRNFANFRPNHYLVEMRRLGQVKLG
jgi:hypothetical protein